MRTTLHRASRALLLFLCIVFSQEARAQAEDSSTQKQVSNEKPRLGVRIDPRDFGAGIRVQSVVPGSSAAQAGIRPGDQIARADDTALSNIDDLRKVVATKSVGDTIKLVVERKTRRLEIDVSMRPPRTPEVILNDAWRGKTVPDATYFEFDDSGRKNGTTKSWRGRLTLIEFWATWCGVCRKASSRLEALAKRNPDLLEVVAVSAESPSRVEGWLTKNPVEYRVVSDATETLSRAFFVEMLPTFILLDEDGVVRGAWVGFKQLDEVETFVSVAIRLRERRMPASN